MQVSAATAPGSPSVPNEDSYFSSSTSVVVLDGLSSPSGLPHGCSHGTPWFVHQLGSELVARLGEADCSMQTALRMAIESVNSRHPQCITDLTAVPASTVVSVRVSSEKLEYLLLSDSVLVLDVAGTVTTVSDSRVSDVATQEIETALATADGSSERAAAVSNLVRVQRRLRNMPGGYWVAAASPEAAEQAITGSVDLKLLRRGALLTDGASRLVDLFGALSWEQLLDTLAAGGPAALIAHTRAAEATDPGGVRWPRYKRSDDAAAAFLTVSQAQP